MLRLSLILAVLLVGCATTPSQPSTSLTVWIVGSPHTGVTPASTTPGGLVSVGVKANLKFVTKGFPAQGFPAVMEAAFGAGTQPDLLLFDNYGILTGIDTDRGHFEGLNTLPMVRDALVQTSGSLSFSPGWQYLIKGSAHFDDAKTLALRAPNLPYSGLPAGLGEISSAAARAVALSDTGAIRTLSSGGFALDVNFVNPPEAGSRVQEPIVYDWWGNERLAFVGVALVYEGQHSVGVKRYLLGFSGSAAGWTLLTASESVGLVGDLHTRMPALSGNEGLSPFDLSAPAEGARFDGRFPESARPLLKWSTAGSSAKLYLVEWSYGWQQGGALRWSASGFVPLTASSDGLEFRAPGIGAQPHRVRIWAIDGAGGYRITPWRTFSYRT